MIHIEAHHDAGRLRLIVDQPRGNVLSIATLRELRTALAKTGQVSHIRLLTIEGAGDNFSYGASIEEHRADHIAEALDTLHGSIRDLVDYPAPTAAVVRGRCLGGGFELALACDFIFASTTAILGAPEIVLGVFPPAAAVLLPTRIGASRAAAAILTGRTMPADAWRDAGLVEMVAVPDELDAAVDRWFDAYLASRSAAALRCAVRACRLSLAERIAATLPRLERLYLDTLMSTRDANEGINAFLEKRPPLWVHA